MYGHIYILYNININIVMLKPECGNLGVVESCCVAAGIHPATGYTFCNFFANFKNLKDYCLSGLFLITTKYSLALIFRKLSMGVLSSVIEG